MSAGATRIERDSLGERSVPAHAHWGIHTLRAVENFPITGTSISVHPSLVEALATVKQAAAIANLECGLLPPHKGAAIVAACRRIRDGDLLGQFRVDVIQGGAGTSSNMNANEVIANAALDHLGFERGRYDVVHPIDDVNSGQSTNDVYPTAVKLAVSWGMRDLIAELTALADAFEERGRTYASVVKIGRTQLQDAVPMTVGDELTAFGIAIREDALRLGETIPLLLECSLGGTAIGSGVTAPSGYRDAALRAMRELTGLPYTPAAHLFEASWDTGALVQASGTLRRTAVKLSKIANDLRLLSSGPQTGLGELRLPPRQAGSSIMPGKVNPVIPEVVNQIAFSVMGADVTVGIAAEGGQLQLNAFEPVIAHALLQSLRWLRQGARVLRELCVEGIEADEELLARRAAVSVGAVTALVPEIGYEAAARAATHALRTGVPLADAVAACTGLSREHAERLLSA